MERLKKGCIMLSLTACFLAAMIAPAGAADYEFVTAGDTGYYASTEYEDCYDSAYNYGGQNLIDFDLPEIRYGLSQEFLETSLNNPYLNGSVRYGLGFSDSGISVQAGNPIAEAGAFAVSCGGEPVQVSYTPAVTIRELTRNDGSIGTVAISSVGLEAKVYEGATAESMAKGAGHYESTSCWDGNIGLFGHNRGSYPYFAKLKDVAIGDIVTYETNQGTRSYRVTVIETISYTDHTYLNEMGDNRITLTTCIANQPHLRLCVQAVEIK